MNKKHIRSYSITGAGDTMVQAHLNGDRVNLSEHYENHPHPKRGEARLEAYLDIYRYDDGNLAWSGSPNGHDVPSAMAYQFLLGLFLEDVQADEGSPKAF